VTRSFPPHTKKPRGRPRAKPATHARRDELKALRRAAAEKLRAENAHDPMDDLSGEQLLERYEPMPRGLDQLGDLPEPEYKPPYWVDIG
jgi:hypothetical protein